MAIFLNLNQLFNSSKIKISPLPFPLLSTIIFLVHPPPLSIPSFTSPLPFLLSSFLPPFPFFKICESYPPFQRYLFITFSLVNLSSIFPPPFYFTLTNTWHKILCLMVHPPVFVLELMHTYQVELEKSISS